MTQAQPPYGQQPPYQPQQQYPQGPGWPPPGPPPGPPRRQGPRKPWLRRHPVLACLGGAFGLLVVIVAIASAAGGGKPSAAPASPAPASATAAGGARPGTSQAPAPKASTVAVFSGSGIKNTPQFTVPDNWKLAYSYDCSAAGGQGNFIVDEDGGNDFGGATVNELGRKGNSSTQVYGDAGKHYLSVNSECSWTVKVIAGS